MYLQLWGINERSQELLWITSDEKYEVRGPERRERKVPHENKVSALAAACELNPSDRELMQALVARSEALARPLVDGGALMRVEAVAVAPFTTGLGNEHPLENGFAFLNPYGLPYLPGSGIKGVLRQAARELAGGEWGDAGGWSFETIGRLLTGKDEVQLTALDVLFGREAESGDTRHVRGALSFWDVVPLIEGTRLAVEVMTPHQTHYYQKGVAPHDSGSPVPINFLTLPPKSKFVFHVACDRPRLRLLAPPLAERERWKELLEAAFEHAFQWLGFGAKTAVGYGSFVRAGASHAPAQVVSSTTAEPRAPAAGETVWARARLNYNRNNGTLTAKGSQNAEAYALGADGERLLSSLPQEVQAKVRANQFVQVRARVRGSTLVAVE
jgi:CRISPR-associated protein Cmr6